MRSHDCILLDISRLVWRAWLGKMPTGIDRTALAYVAHFQERAQAVVQRKGTTRVLSRDLSRRVFDILLNQEEQASAHFLRLLPAGLFTRSGGDLLGQRYFNVGHTGLNQPGHGEWLQRSGVQPVYFVHDLIPLTHPEYSRDGEPARHLDRMRALLVHGSGIIGNSRDTLDNLARFASLQRALTMPPSLVAPLGVSVPDTTGAQGPLLPARPYFVMVGTIEARKNHLLILNIWAELARRLGDACPQLVIIGQRGWESEQAVDMLERCEAIRRFVIELPRCSDEHLAAYVKGARALLFPSFVEGYGLPLVEALACGTPVVASDLSVFRELASEIPDYLSPIDGLGWSRAIEDYAQRDSARRAAQFGRMTGWQAPTWPGHFALVEDWLETLSAPQAWIASG